MCRYLRLRKFVEDNKLNGKRLSQNPNAIQLLEYVGMHYHQTQVYSSMIIIN